MLARDVYDCRGSVEALHARVRPLASEFLRYASQVPAGASAPVVVNGLDWPRRADEAVRAATTAYEDLDAGAAAKAAMGLVGEVDQFIQATEPFKASAREGRDTHKLTCPIG